MSRLRLRRVLLFGLVGVLACLLLLLAAGLVWLPELRMMAALALPRPVELRVLIWSLRGTDIRMQKSAADTLARMGPDAADAVPALIELVPDATHDGIYYAGFAAIRALGRIGPAAVPALIDSLQGAHPRSPDMVARALGQIGAAAQAAVPDLVEILGNTDEDTVAAARGYERGEGRSTAAWALGRIGPPAQAAVPALFRALEDTQPKVRGNAAEALGRISPGAPAVRSALEAGALRDPDPRARRGAVRGLGAVGPAAAPVLMHALRDSDIRVRVWAAEALVRIDPSASGDAMSVLVEAFRSADLPTRLEAAEAVRGLGSTAILFLRVVAARDPDPLVRERARQALEQTEAH